MIKYRVRTGVDGSAREWELGLHNLTKTQSDFLPAELVDFGAEERSNTFNAASSDLSEDLISRRSISSSNNRLFANSLARSSERRASLRLFAIVLGHVSICGNSGIEYV